MKKKKPLLVNIIVFLTFLSLFIQIPGYIILFGGPERLNELPPAILNLYLNTPTETLYLIAANQFIILLAAVCLSMGNQLALNLYFLSFGLQLGMHISNAITRHNSVIDGANAIINNSLVLGSLMTPFLLMLYSIRLVGNGYLSKNESRVEQLFHDDQKSQPDAQSPAVESADKINNPIVLIVAISLFIGFPTLDAALSIYDQRPLLGSFTLLLIFWALGIFTLRGNHFTYIAVIVMSCSLYLTPLAAKLNAPDRILITADPFVATALLILLLTPPVRSHFKERRNLWYQNQNETLSSLANIKPVFFDEKGLGVKTTEARFWQISDNGREFYVVFPKGVSERGYQLESIEQFESLKAVLSQTDRQFSIRTIALTVLLTLSGVVGIILLLPYWGNISPAILVGCITIPAALLIFNALSYGIALDRVASTVDHMLPAQVKLTPLKVLELRNRSSKGDQKKIKFAIVIMGLLIVGTIVLLTFTITPDQLNQP